MESADEDPPDTPRLSATEAQAQALEASEKADRVLERLDHFAAGAEVRLDELGQSIARVNNELADLGASIMRRDASHQTQLAEIVALILGGQAEMRRGFDDLRAQIAEFRPE